MAGNWSEWSEWSQCSESCAGGERSRNRTCTNPPPQNGGTCDGLLFEIENATCNSHACKGDKRAINIKNNKI